MAIFQRETHVDAPFEDVWAFHATVDGLTAVTPDFLDLRVHRVWRPDGTELARDATLESGTLLRLSIKPLGVGPRVEWVSQITAREESADEAFFRDEMRQGPFRRWQHTHTVLRDGDEAVLRDHVEFERRLGQAAEELARFGMAATFRDRHRAPACGAVPPGSYGGCRSRRRPWHSGSLPAPGSPAARPG